MTKMQTAATSLVAAIPAGFLAVLLIMAFLNHAENLQLMAQILVGMTLLTAVAVALTPFAVLVFGGRNAAAAPSAKAARSSGTNKFESADDVAMSTSGEIATADEDTETIAYDMDESEVADDDVLGSDDFDTDDLGDEEVEMLSDDELFIEEEETPPKKKKR